VPRMQEQILVADRASLMGPGEGVLLERQDRGVE
jgi:hypothetical protein